ncbi:hypothetical protein MJO29_012038 [Puccinia striiformis f. sp. tritici]|nr:hypothetical protein MJO29_012038 [Puccinia striiformis f. sp. tritici]
MFASRYSILASLAILAVMGSVCGTPYPTDVGSTPEGQLLEKRDVDEIVDKVHHLNRFVKRQTGNPPRDQRGAAKDPSSAAITLKTLIEVEDGKIKELAEKDRLTLPEQPSGLLFRITRKSQPRVAIQQLSFATDPARLKIQLKALTDLRVDLLKANKDMIDVATGTNRK